MRGSTCVCLCMCIYVCVCVCGRMCACLCTHLEHAHTARTDHDLETKLAILHLLHNRVSVGLVELCVARVTVGAGAGGGGVL